MSNYPLLSIIVPVYNTEKYISRCIETIVSQSMNDYELIIINDASTDKSDEIIKKRISGLKNAKYYVLKKNIGVGNARNIGMENSKGKYETSPAKLQKPSINLPLTISPAPAFKEIA